MLGALRERCARIRAFFRTSDLDRDFEEELQSHVAMLTEDNRRRGMTPAEARRAALIRVGGAASSTSDIEKPAGSRPSIPSSTICVSRCGCSSKSAGLPPPS
jgi:putative ABC transport system permease protein